MKILIGNWDDFEKADSQRYFDFSEAYLKAAIDVCNRMISSKKENVWANASTSMMNAAHSVELFLKGALLGSGEEARGHSIDKLLEGYVAVFPGASFSFDCPFVTDYLGLTEKEIKQIKKYHKDIPSIRLRYPLNRPGVEWGGIYGFTPESFKNEMSSLLSELRRLRILHES